MNNPQAIPTSICAAGALLREVIQSQLNELEPLQRSKLQLALRPDCMSEAMKESLALAVREIHGYWPPIQRHRPGTFGFHGSVESSCP